eukprot:jgi/Botrbrau1/898/Bobra.0167s0019.1
MRAPSAPMGPLTPSVPGTTIRTLNFTLSPFVGGGGVVYAVGFVSSFDRGFDIILEGWGVGVRNRRSGPNLT